MDNQDNYSYEEVLELTRQGVEIWRRVVVDDITFDYEVSNLGRIKSLKWRGNGKRIGYGGLNKSTEYMSKDLLYTDENGNKKRKTYHVHRLVAIMFIPNLYNKSFVDHMDTDKTNNRVNNLRWVTPKENMNNDETKNNMSKSAKSRTKKELTDEDKYKYVKEEDILVEEWKDILGYEGIYKISNMGRVKGLGFKKNNKSRYRDGLLQPHINKYGYQVVNLTDRNGKKKSHSIHQLVAKHFINNPNNYKVVDHISTNRADNRYFNLRWSTQKENMNNDKTRERLSEVGVRLIIVLDKNGNIISNGLGFYETAKNIGLGKNTLLKLLKSHKPYKAPSRGCRNLKHLKTLEGIRAMYYEDSLKEQKND